MEGLYSVLIQIILELILTVLGLSFFLSANISAAYMISLWISLVYLIMVLIIGLHKGEVPVTSSSLECVLGVILLESGVTGLALWSDAKPIFNLVLPNKSTEHLFTAGNAMSILLGGVFLSVHLYNVLK